MKVQVAFGQKPMDVFVCRRCDGKGVTLSGWPSNQELECPICNGTGTDPHPHTYTYWLDDQPRVRVGRKVLCPPFPYGDDFPVKGTIVAIGSDYDGYLKTCKLIKRKGTS